MNELKKAVQARRRIQTYFLRIPITYLDRETLVLDCAIEKVDYGTDSCYVCANAEGLVVTMQFPWRDLDSTSLDILKWEIQSLYIQESLAWDLERRDPKADINNICLLLTEQGKTDGK